MKATVFAVPVLVLALLHLLHRLEVWAERDEAPRARWPASTSSRPKAQPMHVQRSHPDHQAAKPLPHDPPPPPGWVDPLAGTGVEDTLGSQPSQTKKVAGHEGR